MAHSQDESAPPPPAPPQPAPSSRRRWLFRLAAVGLSLAPFVLLELALRACGVGYDTRLVIPASSPAERPLARFNPAADRAYYGVQDLWGPDPRPFELARPADTYRVVVVGGSSVAGFPFPFELALPEHLETVLRRQLPGRKIEVLNAGMIAIASTSEVDIARQALACKPDLLVVHSGHNEFYGPGGSASRVGALTPALLPVHHFLKRQRSFQVLFALATEPPQAQLIETLPAQIDIPLEGPLFRRTLERYRANLRRLVSVVKRSQTPVLVSTVPANLRDLSPLQPDRDPAAVPDLREAELRMSYREYVPALEALSQARKKAPQDPLVVYRQAQCLEALERREEAAEAYALAADLDGCRFRAPRALVTVVREVAEQEQIYFCDVDRELKSRTALAAPGNDYFLEHVHYNVEGNWEAASILGKCIVEEVLGGTWRSDRHPDHPTRDQLLGITPLDRLAAESLATVVFDAWPLKLSPDREKEKRVLMAQISATFERLNPEEREAFAMLDMSAMQHHLWHAMGKALLAEGHADAALQAFERHIRRRAWDRLGYEGAAEALQAQGKTDQAQKLLQRAPPPQ